MDNRSEILKCALESFAARGYDAVGVQEISEAAGITKPTLYHYYGNKQGLLESVLQTYFAPLLSQVQAASVYQHDLPLTLKDVAGTFFSYAAENPVFYRFFLSMSFAPPNSETFQSVEKYEIELFETIRNLFLEASADHGNMKGRQDTYALTYLGMINTYISLALSNRIVLDDRTVFLAVHQFMHGIFS